MWTWFLLVISNCIMVVVIRCAAGGADASPNACLHIDSLSFDNVVLLLTVFEMLLCSMFKCIARLYFYSAFLLYNLDFILLWNILMPSVWCVLSLSIV